MHEEEELRLRRLRRAMRRAPGPACPGDAEWASLAAGLLEPARREELLNHACACDGCGAVLREMTEDFSEEVSEAEMQEIERLRTSTERWQHDFAQRMASESRRPRRRFVFECFAAAA